VIAVLIEHAGEVVTRDALRQAIWGDDTFVDFDKGLNFAGEATQTVTDGDIVVKATRRS
jgi:hypothetical protein